MVGLKIFWVWLAGRRLSRRHQKKHLQSGFNQQNCTRLHFIFLTRDDPEVVRYSCSQPPDLIPLQAEVELEEVIFQSGQFANPNKPCPVGQHYSRWAEYRWFKEGCAAWSHWTHGSLSPQRPQLIMWPLHRSENKSVLRFGLISYLIKRVKYNPMMDDLHSMICLS